MHLELLPKINTEIHFRIGPMNLNSIALLIETSKHEKLNTRLNIAPSLPSAESNELKRILLNLFEIYLQFCGIVLSFN